LILGGESPQPSRSAPTTKSQNKMKSTEKKKKGVKKKKITSAPPSEKGAKVWDGCEGEGNRRLWRDKAAVVFGGEEQTESQRH